MPCIYKISNTKNGKFYIGMTTNLKSRWAQHIREAKRGVRKSILYSAIRKYGIKSFVLEVLEECTQKNMPKREQYWIKKLSPKYNMTKGGHGGDCLTMLTKKDRQLLTEKRRHNTKKMWEDPAYKERQTQLAKKYANTKKAKEKTRRTSLRLWKDPQHRKLVSESTKRQWKDPQHRAHVVRKVQQTKSSAAYKQKMLAKMKKIEMYYPNGSLYRIFLNAYACAEFLGIPYTKVNRYSRENTVLPKHSAYYGYFLYRSA